MHNKDNTSPQLYASSILFAFIATLCLVLAFYAQPVADDYCHAFDMRSAGDLFSYVSYNWQSLNGRWSTTLFRYIGDIIIGLESRYWLTTVIGLLSIVFGFWLFIGTLITETKAVTYYSGVLE